MRAPIPRYLHTNCRRAAYRREEWVSSSGIPDGPEDGTLFCALYPWSFLGVCSSLTLYFFSSSHLSTATEFHLRILDAIRSFAATIVSWLSVGLKSLYPGIHARH